MRSIYRSSLIIALFVVLVAAFVGAPVASAATPNCFGLAAADCQLVAAADANISKEVSFADDFTLTADFTLSSSTTNQSGSTTVKGNGVIGVDPKIDASKSFTGIQMTLNMDGTVKAASAGTNTNQTGKINLVVLNSVIYAQVTDANGKLSAWQSFPLSSPTASVSNAVLADPTNPAVVFLSDPATQKSFGLIPSIKGFITGKRTATARTLEGQSQTEIVYTFDLKTLVSAPEIYPILRGLLKAGGTTTTYTDSQLALVGRLFADGVQGSTAKVTRWIGVKDKLYHQFALDTTFKFDGSKVGLGGQILSANVHFLVNLTKVGQPVSVKAPIAAPPAGAPATPVATPGDVTQTSDAGFPASDAFIPDSVYTRYAGLQSGKTNGTDFPSAFASLGSDDAPTKITQLSSYSCAYCRAYYDGIIVNLMPQIKAGKVQYVFIPITLTGEFDSTLGTTAAFCALDQDRFWEMHEVLFNWQARYAAQTADFQRLRYAALKLGLNIDKFDTCLTDPRTASKVSAANNYFQKLNLRSTPSILINGEVQNPLPSLNDLFAVIDTADNTPSIGPAS